MRIDAIRIQNLASLRGEQPAIELRGGQLGDAGLIAVTGPTGAGKTTLFDAVCLALFDETPRTRGRGRDPRDLLSRGAGEAQVVLDLLLDDGASWRAEWGVHRARFLADGPLQNSRQRIVDRGTGVVLAEGKKQVQALVEKSLGLSFDQFTSVVLIAQGQFAKFLEATDADRSALLERLTGTEIYSELSRAAYERARLAQERVSELEMLTRQVAGLSPAERDELEKALAAAQQALASQQERVDAKSLALRRLEELIGLTARRDAARRDLEIATANLEGAAGDDERCRRGERAALAAPALHQADELRRRLAQASAEAQTLARAAGEARRALVEGGERLAVAWRELLAGRRAAVAEEEARQNAAVLAGETLESLRRQWREVEQTRELTARRRLEADQAENELAELQQENLRAADELLAAGRELDSRRRELQAVAAELAAAGDGRGRDFWARRRLDLQQAGDLAAELRRLDLGKLEKDLKEKKLVAAARAGELEKTQAAGAAARREREEHEALLRLAMGQAELAEHRPLLRPGEPCPLCGAAEHPWAERRPAEDQDVLRRAEAARQLKLAQEQEAERKLSAAAASHQAALLAVERAGSQLDSALQQVKNARGRWLELRLVLPELPVEPAAFGAAELPQIAERLARFDHLLPREATARQALAEAEQAYGESEKQQAVTGERLQAVERRRSEAALALADASGEAIEKGRFFADRAGELARQVGLAPPAAEDEAAGFLARLEAELAAWLASGERRRQLEALEQRLRRRRPELDAEVAFEAPVAVDLARREAGAFEKALEEALAFETTCREQSRLEDDRSRRAAEEEAQWREQQAAAELALEAACAEQLFADEAALRQALLPAAELAALRRRLAELAKERERQEARLYSLELERSALQDLIDGPDEETREPADPAADLKRAEAELAAARQGHAEILASCIDLRSRMQVENDRRAERESREAELAAARAAQDLAARLSALIGQKDGGKFRRFAQQLNLDLLLELANLRLDRLAPRYQLSRLGDSLDLEVIDREMADERRPVSTLSGGESFLVSLALALALADLRRGSLRLGTLFLDEGFGSLDEDTLDTALSVLEQLQADQNTQILIISHVGALKERIDHRIDIQKLGGGRSRLQVLGG